MYFNNLAMFPTTVSDVFPISKSANFPGAESPKSFAPIYRFIYGFWSVIFPVLNCNGNSLDQKIATQEKTCFSSSVLRT